MWINFLFVGIGGFAGAVSRFAMSKAFNKKVSFPFGTLTVNLLGSFLLGMIVGAKVNEMIALLFGTGFLGAFTTFSTMKLELTQLYLKNKKNFLLYIIITYIGGITLTFFGYLIGMIC
ncbi:fluoride efflux transporter FluC [Ureibacillus thermophilus]|uniref:Fluoride-specific ion channel FluC n=1 Tax=Ureibacillus thermophilus TaxID=367743 RepID=A0A4P6UUK2_9BACL|nr:CrcB family protein [Ureibacillus thermophilus]QBK26933.1 CrcB family protein [Ureibacillus thermophilus]